VTDALDAMNVRYGLNTFYLGSIHEVRRQAPHAFRTGATAAGGVRRPADNVRKPVTRYTLTQNNSLDWNAGACPLSVFTEIASGKFALSVHAKPLNAPQTSLVRLNSPDAAT